MDTNARYGLGAAALTLALTILDFAIFLANDGCPADAPVFLIYLPLIFLVPQIFVGTIIALPILFAAGYTFKGKALVAIALLAVACLVAGLIYMHTPHGPVQCGPYP